MLAMKGPELKSCTRQVSFLSDITKDLHLDKAVVPHSEVFSSSILRWSPSSYKWLWLYIRQWHFALSSI